MLKQLERRLERVERKGPFGPWMTWEDYLRGHRDDFLGKALDTVNRYTTAFVGAGTISLLDDVPGGWARFTTGAVAANTCTLWLGDSAGGFDTAYIDTTYGFIFIYRGRLCQLADCFLLMGTANAAMTRRIHWIYNSAVNPNWYLYTANAAGGTSIFSAVAADTNLHWHVIVATASAVNAYIDGALAATTTANIPTAEFMTPHIRFGTNAAAAKSADVDVWNYIPRG